MEYMVAYGTAILILAIALVLLYNFIPLATNSIGNACLLPGGPNCIEAILGTNTLTSNTVVGLYLSNAQNYPITSPNAIIQVAGINSSRYGTSCQPNYVKPGGTILCTVNLPQKTVLNQLLIGKIYITANYCGTTTAKTCTGAQRETYAGYFTGHTQKVVSYTTSMTLTAVYNTLPPNGQKENLTAQVYLLGYPVRSATVNFTADNSVPILGGQICGPNPLKTQLCSSFSNANPQGVAQTNIWSYGNTVVTIYANALGASASMVIIFNNANTPLALSCSTQGSGQLYTVTITDANEPIYNPLSVNPSSLGVYTLNKVTSRPVVINMNGNGNGAKAIGTCFSIDTSVGAGSLTLNGNGNNENTINYVSGDAAVTVSSNGNNNAQTLIDSGNGPIGATDNGNNQAFVIGAGNGNVIATDNGNGGTFLLTSGTGNVVLTVNGNNQAVSNIITQSGNMIFTMNGNNQVVNITDQAPNANVLINEQGNNQLSNLSIASTGTVVVPILSGNNNVFNSIGGNSIFTSIQGNSNIFNLKNENVYIKSCSGSGTNRINLINSNYVPSSPFKGSSC